MLRRAEHVDETRRRIVEAAVRLHTSVGPAHTTIAAIADEAGVTRLTVYRHFPTLEDVFSACTAHWTSAHPMPDPRSWATLRDRGERARAGLRALYGWYRENDAELYPIERDFELLSPSLREAAMAASADVGSARDLGPVIAGPDGVRERRVLALASHLVTYRTWRSLVRDGGLTDDDGADLGARLLGSAAG